MSWFIALLVGIAFGACVGIVVGMFISDEHWRRESRYYKDRYLGKTTIPYEIEKKR